MSESASPFLVINDLAVQYTSGGQTIHAVNGISLSLNKGQTLALVGETGAGKTTIAKSILRILPDRAAKITKGSIRLNEEELLELSEERMCRVRGAKISMVFQDPMTALNPNMRIGEQIAEVIRIHNDMPGRKVKKRTIQMLEMVGITPERYDEYPHQFSGGMKQRVIIAMALACNPQLLLADEPTTALDVTIQAQILEMMYELKERNNTSMILVTHDLGIVSQAADEVAVIYAGEILEWGSRDEIFENPVHPYTVGLFGAIPDLDSDARWLTNIKGLPPDPTNLPAGCCFSPRCPHADEECRTRKFPLSRMNDSHFCSCGKRDILVKEAARV